MEITTGILATPEIRVLPPLEITHASMARVDMIVDDADVPWVLDINTVPGLTELSLLPDAARAAGIPFDELCDRLVWHAVTSHGANSQVASNRMPVQDGRSDPTRSI